MTCGHPSGRACRGLHTAPESEERTSRGEAHHIPPRIPRSGVLTAAVGALWHTHSTWLSQTLNCQRRPCQSQENTCADHERWPDLCQAQHFGTFSMQQMHGAKLVEDTATVPSSEAEKKHPPSGQTSKADTACEWCCSVAMLLRSTVGLAFPF